MKARIVGGLFILFALVFAVTSPLAAAGNPPSCSSAKFCATSPFNLASPGLTAGRNVNCGYANAVQTPTFASSGIAKADLHTHACNSAGFPSGFYSYLGGAGAGNVPWTFTGTTGTVLTVWDTWSVAYSASLSILRGGTHGPQDVRAYIDLNGSTTDYTAIPPTSAGSGTLTVYTQSSTSCGYTSNPSTTPATFYVSYSVTLTH